MAAVVLGIIENAGVISEDFARALEEDENFKIAMEHLSEDVYKRQSGACLSGSKASATMSAAS